MSRHLDTAPLWERVGYLSAQALLPDEVLEVVRIVLRAFDDDSIGDPVWMHSRVTAALLPQRATGPETEQ